MPFFVLNFAPPGLTGIFPDNPHQSCFSPISVLFDLPPFSFSSLLTPYSRRKGRIVCYPFGVLAFLIFCGLYFKE
jgi:hypothetical protein